MSEEQMRKVLGIVTSIRIFWLGGFDIPALW